MKEFVYDLIEDSLDLYDETKKDYDHYLLSELINGKDKKILYTFATTIHCNRGGGEFYSEWEPTLKAVKKPVILLQFRIPSDLRETVTRLVKNNDQDSYISSDFKPNNEFYAGSGRNIAILYAAENFTGIYYKPSKDMSEVIFISAQEFQNRMNNQNSTLRTSSSFYKMPTDEMNARVKQGRAFRN